MNIVFNGEPRETAERITVADLLSQCKLSPQRVAVEVNLQVVPRAQHAVHMLREGDRLEVVTLMGGG